LLIYLKPAEEIEQFTDNLTFEEFTKNKMARLLGR
jgi:uncharacterized protein with HEPN domain